MCVPEPDSFGNVNVTESAGHGLDVAGEVAPANALVLTVTTEAVLVDTGPQSADTSHVTFSVAPASLVIARV